MAWVDRSPFIDGWMGVMLESTLNVKLYVRVQYHVESRIEQYLT